LSKLRDGRSSALPMIRSNRPMCQRVGGSLGDESLVLTLCAALAWTGYGLLRLSRSRFVADGWGLRWANPLWPSSTTASVGKDREDRAARFPVALDANGLHHERRSSPVGLGIRPFDPGLLGVLPDDLRRGRRAPPIGSSASPRRCRQHLRRQDRRAAQARNVPKCL
jgi:hypothetical protein